MLPRINKSVVSQNIENEPIAVTPPQTQPTRYQYIAHNRTRDSARRFVEKWQNAPGGGKQETLRFWLELLHTVYGVRNPMDVVRFEERVKVNGATCFISAHLPDTRVIIEQRGTDVALNAPQMQSSRRMLTPYEQAKQYSDNLPLEMHARWIVTCNFREWRIHDMNSVAPATPVSVIALAKLPEQWHLLRFLVDTQSSRVEREKRASMQAGELIGRIYNTLLSRCPNPSDATVMQKLNRFCVRLVFCFYADDAGLFAKDQFLQYISTVVVPDAVRERIMKLFRALSLPPEKRDPFDDELLAFPYVNGGLFSENDEDYIPRLDEEACALIRRETGTCFNWSNISPTILSGLFESTLNPEARHQGGMHYTSVENIHRVIDPLFLDALKEELRNIVESRRNSTTTRTRKLESFHAKLASLSFLDPACGSGNFLTETYISLRRLENEVLRYLSNGQDSFDGEFSRVKVSLQQFFGIETNDFAVSVAKAALWIASAQMWRETKELSTQDVSDFLPLENYDNIREGDALRFDWLGNIPTRHVDFIIGNPPFVGARYMSKEQKTGLLQVCKDIHGAGDLDYVSAWFVKAAEIMQRDPATRTSFVATNSITQGQTVALLWRHILQECGMKINFAYRTFKWANKTRNMASVHCVIVGFSGQKTPCRLFDEQGVEHSVSHLNGYLIDGEDVFITNRISPICDVPRMGSGNKPIDGGYYLFTPEEKEEFLEEEPGAAPFFHPWMGAEELINGKKRFCLWLGDAAPHVLRSLPHCMERMEKVRAYRAASKSAPTRKIANTPYRFHVENIPRRTYLVLPVTSSERREYLPIAFLGGGTIASNLLLLIPDATLYHFGVLTSAMHMAWIRTVVCRLKSDYRYSNKVAYNNFPWARPTDTQRARIETCAQAVLNTRAKYPESTLADLYDRDSMPDELLKAHRALDAAVDDTYGKKFNNDSDRITHLFALYLKLTGERK